jgi:hypothetical protein
MAQGLREHHEQFALTVGVIDLELCGYATLLILV